MYFKTDYEPEFDDLYMYLRSRYSDKLFDLDGIGKQMDMSYFSKNFFAPVTTTDASVDPNSNVSGKSVFTYDNELTKPFKRLNSYYILWKELKRLYGLQVANEAVEANLRGDIYINDMHGIGAGLPYCFNYSTFDILNQGLPFGSKVQSWAAKHLESFKEQVEQFIIVASNLTLGATGLADLLVTMSYFVKKSLETMSDSKVKFTSEEDVWQNAKNKIDSFVWAVNYDLRTSQSPFTNISLYDKYFLEKVCGDYIFPDGSSPDPEIIQRLQEILLDIMNDILGKGVPITFPVLTACFSKDEEGNVKDKDFLRFISEQNLKYQFINIYAGDSSTLSSCCRLRSEQKSEFFNSFGAGSTKIGSLGVCTIGLPRLAFKHKGNEDGFFEELKERVHLCGRINNAKRKVIQKRINNGNEPLYTHGFMELEKQYSTVGVNGFYECLVEMGYDILTEEGQEFALKLIGTINEVNEELQKKYGAPHNCEQVPGENVSVKIAKKDQLLKYQDKYNIYSNQFIPLIAQADLLDRIKIQGLLDSHFSGGSILHINVDSPITNVEHLMNLTSSIIKQGVVYHAINYVLGRCENGHMTVGKRDTCETCGEPILENFTRVVGFLTCTKNWIKERREEDFPNRQFYQGENL